MNHPEQRVKQSPSPFDRQEMLPAGGITKRKNHKMSDAAALAKPLKSRVFSPCPTARLLLQSRTRPGRLRGGSGGATEVSAGYRGRYCPPIRPKTAGFIRSSPATTKRGHQTRAHGGINMNRTIEIIIGTTGEIQIDAVGFKGPDCEQATKFLEEALGVVWKKIKKPEYHQRSARINKQRVGDESKCSPV